MGAAATLKGDLALFDFTTICSPPITNVSVLSDETGKSLSSGADEAARSDSAEAAAAIGLLPFLRGWLTDRDEAASDSSVSFVACASMSSFRVELELTSTGASSSASTIMPAGWSSAAGGSATTAARFLLRFDFDFAETS